MSEGEPLDRETSFCSSLRAIVGGELRLGTLPSSFCYYEAESMTISGLPLRRFCEYYDVKPTEVLVVYDDMDYACGSLRLKKGGGHGGHNGVCDIIRHGFGDCWRLRIGIGRPTGMTEASHYVLGVPSLKERSLIDQSIQKALDGLVSIVQGKFSDLMNEWHQKEA